MTTLHRRACNLCEAVCGLAVELDGTRIVSIKGDAADPYSKGYICPKALALKDLQEDPDRLRQPMRRTAQGWVPVSWQDALDEAGSRIAAIQKRDGADALGIYWGNPPTHNHGLVLTMNPVFDALRTRNRFSAASVDQLPQYLVNRLMFGNQLMFPVPDVDRTHFWLIFGGNPLASNGSVGSGPDMRGRLTAIRARGGQVVVVDPRRTETAQAASQHLPIRPGGDVWLLLAMLQVVFADKLTRLERLQNWVQGMDALPALIAQLEQVTPELVAEATALSAQAIRQLAHDFAQAPSAAAYGRLGVCQTPHGTLCHWLIQLLNMVTGNLDREGGAMFTTPAFDILGLAKLFAGGGRFARWHSRVRKLPEFSDELPSAALAEEMDTPGAGQIKAMLLVAGNPVLSTPNGRRLDAAMGQLDFCVAIDYYINESTRHANLILPPVTVWERGHFEVAVNAVQVRNVARYSSAAFAKPAQGLEDWEILTALLARVERHRGGVSALLGPLRLALSRVLTPDRLLAMALRLGPQRSRVRLARLRATQATQDLGPLQSRLPQALYTPDKKVNALPTLFVNELQRVLAGQRVTPMPAPPGLVLIGRRQVRSNNSWMHNFTRLVKGPVACTLQMHPADAAARGVFHGDTVLLRSRTGSVQAQLALTEDLREGVVSLPHGWGHGAPGTHTRVANAHPGVSANDVTDELLLDNLTGNAAVNGVPVEVVGLGF